MAIASYIRVLALVPATLWSIAAWAQPAPGSAPLQSPACVRLESQLAMIDRGASDPARAGQIRRYEDALNKQQAELDRTLAQSRQQGCEGGGFFSLLGGQPAQCAQINTRIQQMRANLDRLMNDLQRLQGGSGGQEAQRQGMLAALAQNNCGPQYRAAAQPRGLFDTLFGGSSSFGSSDPSQSGAYRTLCVRTCDGFYYPISFATTPARFEEDAEVCRTTCPAAEVMLYSHRNPGEEVQQAVSLSGRPYTELANAFRYRQEFNPTCSCRKPGQSWAEAMSPSKDRIERGDVVVTEERSKAMSLPKPERSPTAGSGAPKPGHQGSAAGAPNGTSPSPRSSVGARSIRTVGPAPYPVR